MRIRKRQVPLPLSSISAVPLSSSDPSLNRPPVVVVQLRLQEQPPAVAAACFDPQYPSDHPNHPIRQQPRTHGRDLSAFLQTTTATADGQELKKKKKKKKKKEDYLVLKQGGGGGEEERGGDGEKSNYTSFSRKKSVVGAELGTGSSSKSSSSHQAVGSCWVEGEKSFPLKKRRGSLERGGNYDDDDDTIMEINTNKMKIKMNKKFVKQQNDNEQEDKEMIKVDGAGNTVDNNSNDNQSSAKKRGRGGAVMEGSRCSRVNGRGWRCCQQTLVGYSLCEHHLGKGRLRSMTSVRSRSLARNNNNNAAKKEKQPNDDDVHDHDQQAKQTKREFLDESGENGKNQDDDSRKPLMMTTTKKRVKFGIVKARSISSLLG